MDLYKLPDEKVGEYHYVHSRGSAMIVPVVLDGKLVLVKQFRYLWQRESIEFPSGGVKGDDAFMTAKEELAEEASLEARDLELIGEYNPFNGATDEIAEVFMATGLSHAKKEKDESEEFEVMGMTLSDFQAAINTNEIWDGMTLAAWALAKPRVLDYLSRIYKK